MAHNKPSEPQVPKQTRRLSLKFLSAAVILVLLLPLLLGRTALRDVVLNALVDGEGLSVRSSAASLGYLAPLSVTGLSVEANDQKTNISFQKIEAERSWLNMLFSRPDLGTFRFDKPYVDITIVTNAPDPNLSPTLELSEGNPLLPNLTAKIFDATVIFRAMPNEPPPINLVGLDAQVQLVRKGSSSVLILEPSLVFDHQPLTPELCGQGLQLIAPLLADEVAAEGEFSLRLTQCEIPLRNGQAPQNKKAAGMQVTGQLDLHKAAVAMKNTLASDLIGSVLQLVGVDLPHTLTVAQDVTVEFAVIDGRVHHSGLALLLPHDDGSIEISSSGSVGFDETLDLTVSIKLPDGILGTNPLLATLTREPLLLGVGGTLQQPDVSIKGRKGLMQSVGSLLESAAKDADELGAEDVGSVLSELFGEVLNIAKERSEKTMDSDFNSVPRTEPPSSDTGGTPFLTPLRRKTP